MGKQSSRIVNGLFDHKDIVKDGYYHTQVWHNGELVWEKLPDEKNYIFKMKVYADTLTDDGANTVSFGVGGNVEIDWGDGSIEKQKYEYGWKRVAHSYASSDYYYVTITGNITDIYLGHFYSTMQITVSYGIYEILTPFPSSLSNKESFDGMFWDSTVHVVPEDLFVNCINARSFKKCFQDTLLSEIPEKLFEKCVRAQDFSQCFANCINVKEIPSGLFYYNTEATTFFACFNVCAYLEIVPSNLFDNNLKVTNFSGCFAADTNITSAVPELWERTNVEYYSLCYAQCVNSANYASIPDDWK